MVSRVLLLCSALVLGACSSAGARSYQSAAYPEAASAPASPPSPSADHATGYAFEAPADRELHVEADLRLVQASSGNAHHKAKGEPAGGPEPLPGNPYTPELPPAQDTPTEASRKPLLIYTARLGLAVFRVQEQLDNIEKMAKDQGGYLVARSQNEIRVRVPADHFQTTIEAILKLGDVHLRQITADDVTAEYTDLEIRLKNALSVRDRLQALLEKAQKVEEAIEVERELQRVTNEIETMKGRLKLLQELAAYSTIDVAFSERSSPIKSRVELPFPWLETLGLEHLLSL